jgi:hypothetical protein
VRAFHEWYLRPSIREERGLKLLREWLSQEQLAQFDANNYFEVIDCHSGKRYRICHGNEANIVELDDRARSTTGWCFVPDEHLVAGDVKRLPWKPTSGARLKKPTGLRLDNLAPAD